MTLPRLCLRISRTIATKATITASATSSDISPPYRAAAQPDRCFAGSHADSREHRWTITRTATRCIDSSAAGELLSCTEYFAPQPADGWWEGILLTRLVCAAIGLLVLIVAADHLVLGSARLAQRLRISAAVVGVVVIGLGTSAPEFLVSGAAAVGGNPEIGVGNLIGSNIINLTLVLGVAALIRQVAVTAPVIGREAVLAVLGVVLFALLAAVGLNRWTGLALAVAGAAAVALLAWWARTDLDDRGVAAEAAEFADANRAHRPRVEVVRTAAGLAGVLAGAQLLVTNAATIASELGVPQLVIGFTLVALGTSLPELITTIQAQRRGETDLLVGNLFGSNLFNSTIGGGVVGLFTGTESVRADPLILGAMIAASALPWLMLRRKLRISRLGSAILLCCYAAALPLVMST